MSSIEKINSPAFPAVAPEIFGLAVDLAVLATYEKIQLDGEPDLIVELIDLYLEDAPRRLAVMREALAKGNMLPVKREAHGLRGSSANLGALKVALICGEIERIEPADLVCIVEPLMHRLAKELERVRHIFQSERKRRQP